MSLVAVLAAIPGEEWLTSELSPQAGRVAYLVVAGGVVFGSILPVVPTGAIVGAAAATAMTSAVLSLPLVLLLAFVGALIGDLVTFALARRGSATVLRALAPGRSPERWDRIRAGFAGRGWLLVLVGRVAPGGRVPVLVAAAAAGMSWSRLVPAVAAGAALWTLLYGVLGVLTGNLTDSPVVAAGLAVLLVTLVGAVTALVGHLRARYRARRAPLPDDGRPAGHRTR